MAKTRSIAVQTKTLYIPSPGSHLTKKKAEIYGKELERLARFGPLTVERVLEAATSQRNPLHKWFEWNDTKAAEEHRRTQARTLLRSVSIVVETKKGRETSRAFHCITNGAGEDRAQWFDSATVFSDDELREKVIKQALGELYTWKNRYQQYSELAGIFREIEIVEHMVRPRAARRAVAR